MNIADIPQPQGVLKDLNDAFPLIFRAMEGGTQKAREYFDREQCPVEPFLFTHVTRFKAKQFLDGLGFHTDELPNNGLSLTSGIYTLRILKSDYGNTPAPGYSFARQHFWCQGVLPAPPKIVQLYGPTWRKVNLLLLWDVDRRHNLTDMTLELPRNGGIARASAEVYWSVPVPHPALAQQVPSLPQTTDDEEDLPMGLLNERRAVSGREE